MSWRTGFAVLGVFVLARVLRGYVIPVDTTSVQGFATSTILFTGYVYGARTLFRLPFSVGPMLTRTRHARANHQMGWLPALFDGFYRGFLDHRRWERGQLAVLDRLMLLVIVWVSTVPVLGAILVNLGGLVGLCLMLLVYMVAGNFAFLLDDPDRSPLLSRPPNRF